MREALGPGSFHLSMEVSRSSTQHFNRMFFKEKVKYVRAHTDIKKYQHIPPDPRPTLEAYYIPRARYPGPIMKKTPFGKTTKEMTFALKK